MLLINVFIKKLMKKEKNTKNFTPISDVKHSYKLTVYKNI